MACGLGWGRAEVLTAVPMQGGMLMPMVAYHAETDRMQVAMPDEIPQLTPLLVSHPGAGFDPADPWFDALDPSRQGASFSRRYGFIMDSMSDPLPTGTQMWIRKLAGPSELRFYDYMGTAPKAMTPIFGTEGVTNALYWNGLMYHPLVTAPPGANGYTAVFEVYLVDTIANRELPATSSGPLTFEFTNQPDGRPLLTLTPDLRLTWSAEVVANWTLEAAPRPDQVTAWSAVTNTPARRGELMEVQLEPTSAPQFFRMRYQY